MKILKVKDNMNLREKLSLYASRGKRWRIYRATNSDGLNWGNFISEMIDTWLNIHCMIAD